LPDPLYLLDTNILVHYVRGDQFQRRIEAKYGLLVTPTVPLISIVTEGEMLSLARQWGWGVARQKQLGFLLTMVRRVNLDAPGLLAAYAQIDAYSEAAGHSMGKNDIWIAATAAVTGATLLTADRDFDHLDPDYLSHIWFDPAAP